MSGIIDPRSPEAHAIARRVLLVEHIETRAPDGTCLCACREVLDTPEAHRDHAIAHLLRALEDS